jgi:DNA invertase Pin-like site-specific DNA recombinase
MSTAKSSARAIGYIRVSTDQQRESGLGLEAQRAAIEETAARLHLLLTAVHVDAGLSGSLAIDDRPALADVLSTVRRGDTIIVAKPDRLARDASLSVLNEREVAKKGGRILSAAGEGTDDPSATFTRRILDAVAELERALIAARTRAALKAKTRARGGTSQRQPSPQAYSSLAYCPQQAAASL